MFSKPQKVWSWLKPLNSSQHPFQQKNTTTHPPTRIVQLFRSPEIVKSNKAALAAAPDNLNRWTGGRCPKTTGPVLEGHL